MPTIQAVSYERHANQRWQHPGAYLFSANDAVAPLAAQELPKAAMSLPLGFMVSSAGFISVAVQGLAPGSNLFVAPEGRWLGTYIPAAYRSYPFVLASAADGQQVLCIDEASGLLTEGAQGEAFFDEAGQPAQAVAEILGFLTQVAADRAVASRICAALHKHGLIQPWAIKVQGESGEQNVEGLHRIDEAALNALPAQALLELREAGALAAAYCQLLSMQHLSKLGALAQARAQAAAQAAQEQARVAQLPARELDQAFLKGDSISFAALF